MGFSGLIINAERFYTIAHEQIILHKMNQNEIINTRIKTNHFIRFILPHSLESFFTQTFTCLTSFVRISFTRIAFCGYLNQCLSLYAHFTVDERISILLCQNQNKTLFEEIRFSL